ncbi:murein biosynthesis integral membrane protein MurJ [Haloglycomyces albus]|uniref:murein biosynthesis integral membrane protein MurJ n=1 Tax=Haloglycomyces albus TaxID=526067 RepID=UPI00046D2622|nr:murein biosynthesis integral membrane protein MurJ [Haloglycomyces albus]
MSATATEGVGKSSVIMGLGSLVSRITGFGRTVVISAAIGAGLLGNSYTTSQFFPQMIFELVMGGIFTGIILPLFVKARKNDPDDGAAFTQRLLTLAFLLLALATVAATLASPLIARAMSENAEQAVLVTKLTYWMMPALMFYGLAAILGGVLNSRERFAAPMWVPIINNIVVISVGVAFYVLFTGSSQIESPDEVTPGMIMLLGAGTTAGIVIQVMALFPALRKAGFHWKWRFDFRALPLREIAHMATWSMVFVVLNQASVAAVLRFANGAAGSADDDGPFVAGATVYNNSYLIMMMVYGIIGVSIVTALMPRMTRAADDSNWEDLKAHLRGGLRMMSFLVIPAAAILVALNQPAAFAVFQWGIYTPAQAEATGYVLVAAALSLLPFGISQMQLYAFFAQTDTRMVALINIPVIAIRVGCYIFAFVLLPLEWIVVGLFAANGVSYLVSVFLAFVILRRRMGLLGMFGVLKGQAVMAFAAVCAAGVAWLVYQVWPSPLDDKFSQILSTAVPGMVALLVYVLICMALRVNEVRDLHTLVRSKLGR